MNEEKSAFIKLVQTLQENISRIQYGETSVCLKLHAGRIVSITHSLTENIRKAITSQESSSKEIKNDRY